MLMNLFEKSKICFAIARVEDRYLLGHLHEECAHKHPCLSAIAGNSLALREFGMRIAIECKVGL